MADITPRDALEVVREFWRHSDRISPTFDEALDVLTNLVERAGEPVAWQFRYRLWASPYWSEWSTINGDWDGARNPDYQYRPLYALPPAAPGASHE